MRLAYVFPPWLLAQALCVIFTISCLGKPKFTPRWCGTLSEDAKIFTFAIEGDLEGLRKLFEEKAASPHDVAVSTGRTALHYAIVYNHKDICRFLLDQGADSQVVDSHKESAIHISWNRVFGKLADASTSEAFSVMFNDEEYFDSRQSPTFHKIILGLNGADLGYELELSASQLNARDADGRTALSWAVARGDEAAVLQLLKAKADPNIAGDDGRTPLHWAALSSSPQTVKMLLKYKADIDPRDQWLRTPIHYASWNHARRNMDDASGLPSDTQPSKIHHESLACLLSNEADPSIADNWGFSPLFDAAKASHHESLRLLKQHGVPCRGQTVQKQTLLHLVAKQGIVETTDIIGRDNLRGLDWSFRDVNGDSAKDLLHKRHPRPEGFQELFEMLCGRRPTLQGGSGSALQGYGWGVNPSKYRTQPWRNSRCQNTYHNCLVDGVEATMRHLRQTYLGASTHQTLCIMPYSDQHHFVPTGGCYLSRMPDELLCRVLEYLAPERTSHSGSGFGYIPCLHILLVCRRWERLYCSFFYRNIDLGYFGWQNLRQIRQLEAILRQRPDLCDAVRMVRFESQRPSDATCEMIADILSYSKGLRNFELHTEWTQSTWIILNAAKRAPLATLKLSGFGGGPSLQMILKHFRLPTLKKLSLNRYGLGSGDEPGAPWYPSSDAAHEDLSLLLPSTSPCNVTTMELFTPSAPAHVTKSFLQWPARLTNLTMSFIMNSACGEEYTVDAVQEILDDHRHTLQHISLGILTRGIERLPDFSSFTSLESLQMHGYNMFEDSPCRAAARLDAPRLRHLRISFDTEDQHETPFTDFESDKLDWLEDFVGYITPTTNRLETVFVEFDPDVSISDQNWFSYETWPWSYIDQAVGLFAGHNVTMTYTQPHYSKKEWDQWVVRPELR